MGVDLATFEERWALVSQQFLTPFLQFLATGVIPVSSDINAVQLSFSHQDLIAFHGLLYDYAINNAYTHLITSQLTTLLRQFYTQQAHDFQQFINELSVSPSSQHHAAIYAKFIQCYQKHQSVIHHFKIVFLHNNAFPAVPTDLKADISSRSFIKPHRMDETMTLSAVCTRLFLNNVVVRYQPQLFSSVAGLLDQLRDLCVLQITSHYAIQPTSIPETQIYDKHTVATQIPQLMSTIFNFVKVFITLDLTSASEKSTAPDNTQSNLLAIDTRLLSLSKLLETHLLSSTRTYYRHIAQKYQILENTQNIPESTVLTQLSSFFLLFDQILKAERLICRQTMHISTEPGYITAIHHSLLYHCGLYVLSSVDEKHGTHKPTSLFTKALFSLFHHVFFNFLKQNPLVQLAKQFSPFIESHSNTDADYLTQFPQLPPIANGVDPKRLLSTIIKVLSVVQYAFLPVLDVLRLFITSSLENMVIYTLFPHYHYSRLLSNENTPENIENGSISSQTTTATTTTTNLEININTVIFTILNTANVFYHTLTYELPFSTIPPVQLSCTPASPHISHHLAPILIPSLLLFSNTLVEFYALFQQLNTVLIQTHTESFKEVLYNLNTVIFNHFAGLNAQSAKNPQNPRNPSKISSIPPHISPDITARFTITLPIITKKTYLAELCANHLDLILKIVAFTTLHKVQPTTSFSALPLAKLPFTQAHWQAHLRDIANLIILIPQKDVLFELHGDLYAHRALGGHYAFSHQPTEAYFITALYSASSKLVNKIFGTEEETPPEPKDGAIINPSNIRLASLNRLEAMINDVKLSQNMLKIGFDKFLTSYTNIYSTHFAKCAANVSTAQLDPRFPSSLVTPFRLKGLAVSPLILSSLQWKDVDVMSSSLNVASANVKPELYQNMLYVSYPELSQGFVSTAIIPKPVLTLTSSQLSESSPLSRYRFPTVPYPLNDAFRAVTNFYYTKFTFRTLNWSMLSGACKMTLNTLNPAAPVTLHCTILQTAILLVFNYHYKDDRVEGLPLSRILQLLSIPPNQTMVVNILKMLLITQPQPLLVFTDNNTSITFSTTSIDLQSTITVNPYYLSARNFSVPLHIDLIQQEQECKARFEKETFFTPQTVSHHPTTTTDAVTQTHSALKQRIVYNRSTTTDAAIVRFMKQIYAQQNDKDEEKPIKYGTLYDLCSKYCEDHFGYELDLPFFKLRVEAMIDYDYIMRDENDHTLLYYNP